MLKWIVLFSVCGQISFGQTIDLDKLKYQGLDFYSEKVDIFSTLALPLRIDTVHYECGFLSDVEQGVNFYSLEYKNVVFTGNDFDGYLIEVVIFENNNEIQLKYGTTYINCETSINSLATIFGFKLNEEYKLVGTNGSILIPFENADDALEFEFIENKLTRITYWSPC